MTAYTATTLLTTVAYLCIGLFVVINAPHRLLNRIFFFFCTTVALWALGYFMTLLSEISYGAALFASRISHAIGAFIPITFLHLTLVFLRKANEQHALIKTGYILSSVMSLLCFTPLVVNSLLSKMDMKLYPEKGPLYIVYALLFLVFAFFYAHYHLLRTYLSSRGIIRKRLLFFAFTSLLGFAGGISLFLLIFNIPVPPYASSLIALYPFAMAYTIFRYREFDIEVIVKKTVILSGLFVMAMGIISTGIALSQKFLDSFPNRESISIVISGLVIVFLYEPTKNLLVNLTDKFLFQKTQNFRQILTELSQTVIAVLDIDKIGRIILNTVENALRLESGAILLKTEDGKAYRILDSFGLEAQFQPLDSGDPLVGYFSGSDKVVNLDLDDEVPDFVKKAMADLKARVLVPLFFQAQLIGLLALGKKKSDQEYTRQEMEYFPVVAAQIALALSNALSHETILKSRIEFAQQGKLAAIGTLSAGITHDIKNFINSTSGLANVFLINEEKGFYKSSPPEETMGIVREILQRVSDNMIKANGVVDRLSSFARKPKELKTERIDVKEALEGALGLIKSELQAQDIKLLKEYETDVPSILADLHAMEEVFLNLLVNARHAIKEKGTITVGLRRTGEEVEAFVQDTGCGIPAETLPKIFDPFFTTKDASRNSDEGAIQGSGLGLHLVKELIKQYKGRITVESTVGEGTIFRLFFPKEGARG